MMKPDEPSVRDNDGLHKRRGIWYYCLIVNGQRRFFSTKTRNWQGARKARAEAIKAQLENRLPTDMAKWRFEQLAAQVLEDRKPHLAETTINLEKECAKPLTKYFSGRRVCEIDNAAIRAYQAARSKQVGNGTINLEVRVLRYVLKAAKVWGALADEYRALPEDRRGPGRALDESQERLLFEVAKSRPGCDVAFYASLAASNTTCRSIELKKLRVEDLSLIDREILIRKSKTDAGARRIPLNDAALWAFARLLERANALGSIEPEHFLFPAPTFKARAPKTSTTGYDPTRHQKTWRTAWGSLIKETARRAGREAAGSTLGDGLRVAINAWKRAAAPFKGLRFHDLRHTAITKLAESEASDQTIMSISGHLNRAMLEHYSHIRAAAKRKAVDAIRGYVPEETTVPATKRVQ